MHFITDNWRNQNLRVRNVKKHVSEKEGKKNLSLHNMW